MTLHKKLGWSVTAFALASALWGLGVKDYACSAIDGMDNIDDGVYSSTDGYGPQEVLDKNAITVDDRSIVQKIPGAVAGFYMCPAG